LQKNSGFAEGEREAVAAELHARREAIARDEMLAWAKQRNEQRRAAEQQPHPSWNQIGQRT